jgi:Holliday junction resolvase RusA-like endonuclease
MIDFFIPCNPPKSTAQGSSRIMKRRDGSQFVGRFANSKATKAKSSLLTLLHPHRPETPLEGPLRLEVEWEYPWRKSEPKKNKALGFKPCDTRPDVDNLSKMLLDAMTTAGFWNDDGQVAHLSFYKSWSDKPGIGIRIVKL